jgi:hypothetical protein
MGVIFPDLTGGSYAGRGGGRRPKATYVTGGETRNAGTGA